MLDLLVFVAAAAVVATTALLLVDAAAPRGLAATLTGLGIAAYATVVLAAEALSLLGHLGRGGLLVAHVLLLGVAALAWKRAGRARSGDVVRLGEVEAAARAAAQRHPLVAAICAVAAAAMAIQLVVGLIGAPTNWDSMTFHLSRAAYWLQEGAALRFDGGSLRQLDSLPNAELATAWTMAVSGSDSYVELVQWLALATCVPAIIGLARLLGFSRAESAAAAALFVMLPGPVLQSVTTQNDLVAAACVLAAGLLGARGLRDGHPGTLALAGAAIGLGLGSKGTVLPALPAIAIMIGAAAWRAHPSRRTLVAGAAATVAGFALFGAFQYMQNLADTGSPFGDQVELVGRERFGVGGNAARVLWNFVDSPGVPLPVADRFFSHTAGRVIRDTGEPVSVMKVGTEVDHDRISGGLVGWLVLWPLALGVLLLPGVRLERRAQAAAAVSFALAIAVLITATPFNGRILLPFLALAAPLLALVAQRRWSLAVTGLLALASLIPCLLISSSHVLLPERGQEFFFERDRTEQVTVMRPDQATTIRHVEQRFGPDAPLIFIGGEDSWDYPYFGADLARRVVRVDPDEAPADDERALCRWLLERVERERVAGVLMVDAPTDVPLPPAAARPARTSPSNYVLGAPEIRRGCT